MIKTRIYSSNVKKLIIKNCSMSETPLVPSHASCQSWHRQPPQENEHRSARACFLPEYPLTYSDEARVEKIDFTTREETDELGPKRSPYRHSRSAGERTITCICVVPTVKQIVSSRAVHRGGNASPCVTQVVKIGTG